MPFTRKLYRSQQCCANVLFAVSISDSRKAAYLFSEFNDLADFCAINGGDSVWFIGPDCNWLGAYRFRVKSSVRAT